MDPSPLRRRLGRALLAALVLLPLVLGVAVAAGPPFPEPTNGVRVYDEAGIFSAETRATAEATIRGIEDRSRAQIAVYTQLVEDGRTTEQADRDALALMN